MLISLMQFYIIEWSGHSCVLEHFVFYQRLENRGRMRGLLPKITWCFLPLHTGSFVRNPALTSTGSNMREGGKEGSSWTRQSMSPLLVNFIDVSHCRFNFFFAVVSVHTFYLCFWRSCSEVSELLTNIGHVCALIHMHVEDKHIRYSELIRCILMCTGI